MTLEIDLAAIKGRPLDRESTPSIATDDDSQQSLTVQQNPTTAMHGFSIMSSSHSNESENEDDPDEEIPIIDLDERTSKPSFTCEVCAKVYDKRSRLVSHMVTHSEQKDHICGVCGKGFKNKPQLIRHSNTHSVVPNFCCNICGRGFKHNDVAKHIRRWHSGPRKSNRGGVPNPDALPNGQFPTHLRKKKRSQLNAQHQQRIVECHLSQQGEQGVFAGNSSKGERQKVSVLQHETHSLDLGRCSIDAMNASNLQEDSSSPSLFQCLHCPLSFSKQQEFACHLGTHREAQEIILSKDGKKLHQCHICDKTFTRGSGLTGHMHLHTRTEKRREPNPDLRCHICDKIFTRRSGLNAHILQHGGVLRFWCDETDCGKGFVHSYQLIRHKRSHSEVPPYSCEVCGRAFRHNDLAKHMRTHTGVKPYNCQHCGRAFAFNSSLRAHERMHLALKEHVCEVCNMGFTTSAGLRRHAKCHEDEEEKLCAFCGELFPSKLHLNLHLQESQHCAEQARQHQSNRQELSDINSVHQHQEAPPRESLQQIHQQHAQQAQQMQHLQVMPLPQAPPEMSLHKVHGLHEPHQQVPQQSHPIPMHSLNPLHVPNNSDSALVNLSAARTEPVNIDSGPTSGQAMPVLVPFSVSVPISVPYGVNATAPDPLQLNHFLTWESKY